MSGKLKKNIGFSMLPIAFFFLFEPSYALIDPLPDALGYMILCAALSNLADISPKVTDALSGFQKGILFAVLRYVAYHVLTTVFVGAEQAIAFLIFVFILDLFELIVLIPAYRALFEGLLALGMMHDGEAVYQVKARTVLVQDPETGETVQAIKESRNLTECAYFFTAFFLVINNLASFLPELSALIGNNFYEFIIILRVLLIIVALPVGIAWLFKMVSYCAKLRADRPFIEKLSGIYLHSAEKHASVYISRQICAGLMFLVVGSLLTARIYAEKESIIPEALCFIFFIAGALFLCKKGKGCIPVTALSVLSIVASYIAEESSRLFYIKYDPGMVRKSIYAYNHFYTMVGLKALAAFLYFSTVLALFLFLRNICKKHLCEPLDQRERREMSRKYLWGAAVNLVLCAISCFANVFYVMAQPFYKISGNMLQSEGWYYYYSGTFSSLMSLVFAFGMCYFLFYWQGEIKNRYHADSLFDLHE